MSPSLRSFGLNALLAVVSTSLFLVAGEVTLRILASSAKGGKEQRERNSYTEYDPVLGWRKKPGARARYDRRDFHTEFSINGHGLRGPERPFERTAGVPRVLALGDSFIEAFTVNDPEMVTTRLEKRLSDGGCRSEVINGGTIGYSTDQEYLFYRDTGRRYGADVVVLFVYHNDIPWLIHEDYLGYPKPVLDFSGPSPVVRNEPVAPYVPPPVVSVEAPPFRGSFLFEFVKDSVESASAETYQSIARLGLWGPLRTLPLNEELRLFRVPEFGHLRPAWSAFTWSLQSLGRAVSADGAQLVVAYIPSKMEVMPRVWERTRIRYALDEKFERTAIAARVRSIVESQGLPFLDLTPVLRDAEGILNPVFCPVDGHWNARGQDVAAGSLAGFLRARNALPDCR